MYKRQAKKASVNKEVKLTAAADAAGAISRAAAADKVVQESATKLVRLWWRPVDEPSQDIAGDILEDVSSLKASLEELNKVAAAVAAAEPTKARAVKMREFVAREFTGDEDEPLLAYRPGERQKPSSGSVRT